MGEVARVIMDVWADKVNSVLVDNEITVFLLAKYVDDINIATALIPPGSAWKKEGRKWKLYVDPDQRAKDLSEGKSPQQLTMEKILWLGDRLVPGIKLTMDLPSFHDNGKCPMLDLQVWVDTW